MDIQDTSLKVMNQDLGFVGKRYVWQEWKDFLFILLSNWNIVAASPFIIAPDKGQYTYGRA